MLLKNDVRMEIFFLLRAGVFADKSISLYAFFYTLHDPSPSTRDLRRTFLERGGRGATTSAEEGEGRDGRNGRKGTKWFSTHTYMLDRVEKTRLFIDIV